MSILTLSNILRSEIDAIIVEAHSNDMVEKDMLGKAMAVKGVVGPYALYASGAQSATGRGADSAGGEGKNRRGRRLKGGHQQQQRQQQHPQKQLQQPQPQPQQQRYRRHQHRHLKQDGGGRVELHWRA